MPTIPWLDFKELRQRLSIADVLAHYRVNVTVKGEQGSGFCPLPTHAERTGGRRKSPSFSVNLTKNVWQCFGCGARGNVLDLACRLDGLNPDDGSNVRRTAIKLARAFGLLTEGREPETDHAHPTPEIPDDARKQSRQVLVTPAGHRAEGEAAAEEDRPQSNKPVVVVNAVLDFELKHLDASHPYLLRRGFTPETIERFGLGYCNRGLLAGRVAIPVHDAEGRRLAYAGRLVDDDKVDAQHPKYKLPPPRERDGTRYEFHKSLVLYNLNRIERPTDDLIVVEGFPSVWWLTQHGFPNVVALMGGSCSPEQARLIIDATPASGRIWCLPDGDEAGERCAQGVLAAVAPHRWVRWPRLPEGQQPTDLDHAGLVELLT